MENQFDSTLFQRYPELKEFVKLLRHEIQQAQRPANEIVLNDEEVMKILSVCKRTLCTMKSEKVIAYSQEATGKPSRFLLSDVIAYINKHRIDTIESQRKI
jgi:hypothetical protein